MLETNLKPGTEVLVKATVLRLRGAFVEVQIADGQFLRTRSECVEATVLPSQTKPAAGPPKDKAVLRPGQTKGGKGAK